MVSEYNIAFGGGGGAREKSKEDSECLVFFGALGIGF